MEAGLIGFDAIPPLHETDDAIARLGLSMLGAVTGTELVGVLGYRRIGSVVDIDRLAVHPRAFRAGLATSLVEELHRRELGAATFEVRTGAGNAPAVALYTKLGYSRAPDEVLSSGIALARFVRVQR